MAPWKASAPPRHSEWCKPLETTAALPMSNKAVTYCTMNAETSVTRQESASKRCTAATHKHNTWRWRGAAASAYSTAWGRTAAGAGARPGARSGCARVQEWTLKASSCSECMLLRERRSGSFSSSLVKMADSLGWFLVMRLRSARISVSCSASTEFTFSMPERSAGRRGAEAFRHIDWLKHD